MSRATQYERYMLELVNAERAKAGAPPLQLERNLNRAADNHSAWMLAVDVFSHTGVDGSSPTDRIRDAQFDLRGNWRTAENIAVQSERGNTGIMDDVKDLHVSLMNSPGHRANILNPDLDYIGIGIALGDFDFNSGTYRSVIVTQKFATTGGQVDLDLETSPNPQPVSAIAAAPAVSEDAVSARPGAQADDSGNAANRSEKPPVVAGDQDSAQQEVQAIVADNQQGLTEDTFKTIFGESGADLFSFIMRDLTDTTDDHSGAIPQAGPTKDTYGGDVATLAKDLFRDAAEDFALAVQNADDGLSV